MMPSWSSPAVFVVLALDGLHRHDDSRQPAVSVHRLEARRDPGVGPELEGSVDIVVIFREPLAQVARSESRAGPHDRIDADRLVDCVRRQGHPRPAAVRDRRRHSSAQSCRRRCGPPVRNPRFRSPSAGAAGRGRPRSPCSGHRDRTARRSTGHSRSRSYTMPPHRVASQSFWGKSRHISMQPSPSCRKTSVVRSEPVILRRRRGGAPAGGGRRDR